jgi:hypothetical protein
MFNKTGVFVPATLAFFGLLGMPAAFAQGPQCYSLASLKGSYAVIGDYGAHVAITLATRSFDGQGNLSGTFIVNEPKTGSATGERTIVTGTQKGTYTVNCDGTGVFTRFVTLSDGTTATQYDDFVITAAFSGWTSLVATKIVDAQRTPSIVVPGGIFLTRTYSRLPDQPQ